MSEEQCPAIPSLLKSPTTSAEAVAGAADGWIIRGSSKGDSAVCGPKARARVQQNPDVVVLGIRVGDIRLAVAVEIGNYDGARGAELNSRLTPVMAGPAVKDGPVLVPQKDGDGAG